jgi:hypothetical protein
MGILLFASAAIYEYPEDMNLFKAFLPAMALATMLTAGVFCERAEAKDLSGRLGIGFNDQFATRSPFTFDDIPALSAKYAISRDIAFAGIVGLNTHSPSGFTLGGKVFKNIFYETNLNFYVAGALALLKRDQTGFEAQTLFGTEVFIPGIDSLGLSFEAGLAAGNSTGSFTLRTVGYTFLHAGVHFYF